MDQNQKDKSLENLTKAESILIAASDESGFDGLASALSVYLSLVKLGKSTSVVANEPSVGDAQKVYGIDKIGKVADRKTPVIVIQNAIDTVENVTYSLDGDKLKVVIHPLAAGPGVTQDQISFDFTASPASLIFAIGFDSMQHLQKKLTHEQQISPNTWIISVNKGELKQKFAQDSFLDPQASSLSQVTALMLQELAMPLDEDIAFNLYSAISESTDKFSPTKTNPRALEIAAWLLKFGAGRASLAKREVGAEKFPGRPPIKSVQDFFENVPAINDVTPIEDVERSGEAKSKDWLKPPKIYHGSKSFGEGKE